MKQRGFTLIELLAVIVILAIIALITTPIILNIINDSKKESDKRSIEAYKNSVKTAAMKYQLKENKKPTKFFQIEPYIEYSGTEVDCFVRFETSGNIIFENCDIVSKKIKKTYKIGDVVSFAGSKWYVIKDSDENLNYVTLLKDYPLTIEEIESNGFDSKGVNHVNQKTPDSIPGKALNTGGYGGIQYYTNSTCGVSDNRIVMTSNCKTSYDDSDIKYIVDNWSESTLDLNNLKEVPLSDNDQRSYKSRLITYDELYALGCSQEKCGDTAYSKTKTWIYYEEYRDRAYSYWTMTPKEDANLIYLLGKEYNQNLIKVNSNAGRSNLYEMYLVRPVINLLKSKI